MLPDYRFLEIDVPDDAVEQFDEESPPRDTVAWGDERLGVAGVLGFSVAGVVLPLERNVVLNPDHPDFAALVTHGDMRPFVLDKRLLLR